MRQALTIALGGLALAGGFVAEAWAGDPVEGRKIANMCRTCHGLDGYATVPIAPHIGGEPEEYLADQLLAFKTGAREHEMMTIVVGGLTEKNIEDVSAWYAGHDAAAALPENIPPENAPEACVACHGVDGISLVPDAPNLAGESSIYIDTQLKAFKRGQRTHDIMSVVAADLSDDEIRAVANWYASIPLTILLNE